MKLRTIFIVAAVVIAGSIVVSNIRGFKKLPKSVFNRKMTRKNFAYKDLFADTSRFSNAFTFYSDASRDSIGAYVVDKNYDLVLYKIRNLKLSDNSFAEGFSFVKSQEIERSTDVVYESSYKAERYRFSVMLDPPKPIRHLKINYDGEIIGKPIFTPTSIKINMTNLAGLAALTEDEKQVEFAINKSGPFTKDFALQILIFKKDGAIYFAALCNRDNPSKPIDGNVLEGLLKN